jgi:hypothetical protein
MKSSPERFLTAATLALALAFSLLPAGLNTDARAFAFDDDETTAAQDQQANALQRGWRTGYSDGYQAGWRDSVERRTRDYRSKDEYQRGDRVYIAAYGAPEDYRDGYQQGFEVGYEAGYDRRGFDSTVPDNLRPRGAATMRDADGSSAGTVSSTANRDADDDYDPNTTASSSRGANSIPAGTTLRVELSNRLSSDVSQRGDPFEARVVEPREYEGAIVSGRVTRVRRAGKVRGTAELQLSFDQIRMPDGRFEDFGAQVVEVVRTGEDAGVGGVDAEGGVRGESSTKDDVAKVGASAGIGAIIGAIAGGGKGAAIGAAIGGAVGTGGVMTQRGKEIRLERGQQIVIRTSR